MKNESQATAVCPKCGRQLAPDAPRGLCRKCLLSGMMADGPLNGSAKPAPSSLLPREFGGYELLSEIARGGMGIVYRARQIQLNRMVALKVMVSGQFAAPDFVKRFRTEAEAVARLDHPNIVPIYEVGESEGQPFFSMKLIEEGSLAQRISKARPPISNRDAATLILKLAGAVHYAHQRGILHRDLKPGNVLIDAQGEPYLTDFGLARLVEKDSTLTRTMAMLGTPSYMSPEQARGEARQLTTAVDVYGLGALFYELLAGQPPFAGGTTMETVRQVLDQEPRRPTSWRIEVDRDLETICLKCLAKDPTHRYSSAEALANDLERWLKHEPILARPATTLERAAKLVRRHPVGTAFTGSILLIITVSVVMLARANVHIRKAQSAESMLRDKAERKAEESRQQLVRLNVGRGNRLMEEGDYFQALLSFTEALRLEDGDSAREDIHRRRFAAVLRQSPALERIWFHESFVNAAEFSPGNDRVLSRSDDGNTYIWDRVTGERAMPPLRHPKGLRDVRFLRDGRRILTLSNNGELQFWDAVSGEMLGEPRRPEKTASHLEVSPDGRWYALCMTKGVQLYHTTNNSPGPLLAAPGGSSMARFSRDSRYVVARKTRELQFWDLAQDPPAGKVVAHPDYVRSFALSHDDRMLAATTLRGVFVWDVATGEAARPAIPMNADLFNCSFSPVDRHLAVPTWDGSAYVFDSGSALPVGATLKHRAGVKECAFSPDGRQLATASWDHTARIWNPRSGQPISPSLPHGGYVSMANFSSDGAHLVTASQDQTVRLWNVRTNSGARLTLRHDGAANALQFSRDGKRLLVCSGDGRANVWDPRTGRLLLALPRQSRGLWYSSFSPDGKLIATGCDDGGVRLYNSVDGQLVVPILQHGKEINFLAFSPDGGRVATASRDGTASVWRVADGRPITPMLRHERDVYRATFSPDGQRVLTASKDKTARVWDATSGELIFTIQHEGEVTEARYSPDGQWLMTACSDRTQLGRAAQRWDGATGKAIGPEMPHLDGVLCAQISPDGRFIVTGGEDRVATIWDASTSQRFTPPMHQANYISRCEFSPDGRLLLTVADAGSDLFEARIWESATGEPVTPVLQHSAALSRGAWSPDGQQVAIGADDGTISLWDVSPVQGTVETLRREAETLAAHRLDPRAGISPLSVEEIRARWNVIQAERHER